MPPWGGVASPGWSAGIAVPAYLALRQGRVPVVVVAPHGGRRLRPPRRGDSVNDLHTAAIAWELAERLDAHAIVNHGLDRNDADLNRITHLVARAPGALALLAAAVAAAATAGSALVVFVHGWNMVVPCCDIGVGLRRRGGRVSGRHPTVGPEFFDDVVVRMERELDVRGVGVAVGRRYTASGRDNAAQLFSGRHAAHADETVAALGCMALAGRVDAAQLELGIPLRWPGPLREAFLDGMAAALAPRLQPPAPGGESPGASMEPRALGGESLESRVRPLGAREESLDSREQSPAPRAAEASAQRGLLSPRPARGWSEPALLSSLEAPPDPGCRVQAVLDAGGRWALFSGVEATSPHSMAARLALVGADGSMMLMVGEGEWDGRRGHFPMDGFLWRGGEDRIEIELRAPMVRYRSHAAFLDLEEGLSSCRLVDADVRLVFEPDGPGHGRLRGHVAAGGIDLDVSTTAFVESGGRRAVPAVSRVRVFANVPGGQAVLLGAEEGSLVVEEGAPARIRVAPGAAPPAHGFAGAEIVARVPVLRPLGDGSVARVAFGIARCAFAGGEATGLFETMEILGRPPRPAPA